MCHLARLDTDVYFNYMSLWVDVDTFWFGGENKKPNSLRSEVFPILVPKGHDPFDQHHFFEHAQSTAHAQKLDPARSRCLVLTKSIVASGDENVSPQGRAETLVYQE